MIAAANEAHRLGQSIAGPELVLLALLRKDCDAAGILGDFGFDAAVMESSLTSRSEITDAARTSITFPPISAVPCCANADAAAMRNAARTELIGIVAI